MKGIIVIDGPDACGKTTLANAIKDICDKNNVPFLYQHATYRFKDKMFMYHEAIVRKAIRFSEQGIAVIDRLHWSEYVYSSVYRGASKWPLQWRFFDRLLQKHGAFQVIACNKTTQQVFDWHKEAAESRGEMYKTDIRIHELASHYIDIFNRNYHRKDYFFYDRGLYSDYNGALAVAQYLIDQVQEFRQAQLPEALKTSCYNLLGYVPRAEILFVGDKLNNKGRHDIWPFWEYGFSSLYFTKILDELGFDESRAVWTNFNVNEYEFYIDEILSYNEKLKVICLNKQAKFKWQPRIGKNVTAIYHPSYARRFNVTDYAQMVKEAIDAPAE